MAHNKLTFYCYYQIPIEFFEIIWLLFTVLKFSNKLKNNLETLLEINDRDLFQGLGICNLETQLGKNTEVFQSRKQSEKFLWQEVFSWALARLLSWLEHRPVNQNVTGSIHSQGTYLGCGFHPWLGHIWEATDRCFLHRCLSVSLYLSLSPSLFPFLSL